MVLQKFIKSNAFDDQNFFSSLCPIYDEIGYDDNNIIFYNYQHFENKTKIAGMTRKQAHDKRKEIADHLLNGRKDDAIKSLHELHNKLDNENKEFTRHVWRAGITGEHKFKGEEGKANYVLIQGRAKEPKKLKDGRIINRNKKAKLYHVEHYLKHLEKNGKLVVPDVSESKRAPEDKEKREYPNELSIRLRV